MLINRLPGLLALVLGFTGTLAGIIVCIGVWPVTHRLGDEITRISDDVEPELANVEQQLEKADHTMQEMSNRITRVQTAAHNVAEKGENSDPSDLEKIEETFTDLSATVARAEGLLIAVQGGITVLINLENFSRAVPGFGSQAPQQDSAKRDQLKKAAESAKEISTHVAAMKKRLDAIKQDTDISKNAGELEALANRIESRLKPVADRVGFAKQFATKAREILISLRESVGFLQTTVPLVLTLLFAWMAVAQTSLLIHGWKLLFRKRAATESNR